MPAEIRKTLLHVENTFIEGGKAAKMPLKLIAALAVIKNPWAGQGFVENLRPKISFLSTFTKMCSGSAVDFKGF